MLSCLKVLIFNKIAGICFKLYIDDQLTDFSQFICFEVPRND